LRLDGGGLGRNDRSDACIACPGCGRYDASQHRGHEWQLHALLGFQAASEVALGKVREFVGEYRSVFRFGLGVDEQAAVHADNAAGCGKGVQLRTIEQDEFQAPILQLAGLGQAVDATLQVVLHQRVGQLLHLAAQQTQPGTPELMFLFGGNDARAGIAE